MEKRADYQRAMRTALAFSRLLLVQRPAGLLAREIAEHLDVSVRHAHRLVAAAELAGWPLEVDEDRRWRLASGAR